METRIATTTGMKDRLNYLIYCRDHPLVVPDFLRLTWSRDKNKREHQIKAKVKVLAPYIAHISQLLEFLDLANSFQEELGCGRRPKAKVAGHWASLRTPFTPQEACLNLKLEDYLLAWVPSYTNLIYGSRELMANMKDILQASNQTILANPLPSLTTEPRPADPSGTFFLREASAGVWTVTKAPLLIPGPITKILQLGLDFVPQSSSLGLDPLAETRLKEFDLRLGWKWFFYKPISQNTSATSEIFLPKRLRDRETKRQYPNNIAPIIRPINRIVKDLYASHISPPIDPSKRKLPAGKSNVACALKWFEKRSNLVLKPADKGGGTIIMDALFYISTMEALLQRGSLFTKVETEPLASCVKRTLSFLEKLRAKKCLSPRLFKLLSPTEEARIPPIYGLPKIHKAGCLRLRPIVSGNGHPTEGISIFLDTILQPLSTTGTFYLRDGLALVNRLSSLGNMSSNIIMFSLDIRDMYTMIPQELLLNSLSRILAQKGLPLYSRRFGFTPAPGDVVNMARLVLEESFLEFNGTVYRQTSGIAMGTPSACVLTDIFIQDYMEGLFKSLEVSPLEYFQYRDDGFGLWRGSREGLLAWFSELNGVSNPAIQFDIVIEQLGCLDYLDLHVELRAGRFTFETFYKPTRSNDYLHYSSAHPPGCKNSIFRSQTFRHLRNCSHPGLYLKHIHKLRCDLLSRGYPSSIILKPSSALQWFVRKRIRVLRDRIRSKRVPLVVRFNDRTAGCATRLRKLILQKVDPDLIKVLGLPMIAFSEGLNLRDSLVKAKT